MLKPPLPILPDLIRKTSLYLASFFQVEGRPGNEMVTEGQLHIFAALIFRLHKRVQIICSTQYGKSLWVALACVIIACIQGKKVAVVAPSNEKAKIIMRYFIEHLGDSPWLSSQLEKNSRLERLRQEENKERIILRNGGGIFVISAQQKNASKSIEAAMGAGAEIVVMDEACLIQDNTEATLFRMIAGKGPKAFYCKIGNPFYTDHPYTHFSLTWESGKYFRIFIDDQVALAEGRYNQDFLDEAATKPLYNILFKCEFPDKNIMDEKGYRPLLAIESFKYGITADSIKEMLDEAVKSPDGLKIRPRLGGDIGGGGDWNVFVVRWGKFSAVVGKNRSKDTMVNINEIDRLMAIYHVRDSDVMVDDIGIGRGVSDRLKERDNTANINGVSVGDPAKDSARFSNLKAELNWEAKLWVEKKDSRVDEGSDWHQGTWIKYKVNSDKQLKLEPKDELKKKHNGQSPDTWDAFVLTFYEPKFVGFI